jgi:hypothetical protein
MACFWIGLLRCLNSNDWAYTGMKKPSSPKGLVHFLKSSVVKCGDNVLWQGETLSTRLQQEIVNAVRQYDENSINCGHLTSSCDPFLITICHLFQVSIDFCFAGNVISYQHKTARRIIKCRSSSTHFY